MLRFFKQLRLKRERNALYENIRLFVNQNFRILEQDQGSQVSGRLQYSLPSEEEIQAELHKKVEEKRKEAAAVKEASAKDSDIKYSRKGLFEDPDETAQFSVPHKNPRLVTIDGKPVLLDGEPDMPTFTNEVKRLMRERGLTGVDVCRRVLIDRRLWSKLNTDVEYQPSRETALAVCIALRLNEEQVQDLLKSAGYTLSNTRKQDVVMRYFFQNSIYDIDAINDMLYRFRLKCIGTNVRE